MKKLVWFEAQVRAVGAIGATALVLGLLPGPRLWAQPVQQAVPHPLVPGGSLARSYQNPVLEKAGDFNKHHIRVLVVLDAQQQPVGMKVAGHAQADICRQTSAAVIELAQALDARKAVFGQRPGTEGYYVSFGLFDGPVNPKYRKEYQAAWDKMKAIAAQQPGQLVIRTMAQDEWQQRSNRPSQWAEWARQNGQPLLVLHRQPEPFFDFVPLGSLPQVRFDSLKTVVQAAASREYLAKVQRTERQLQAMMSTLRAVRFPVRARYTYNSSKRVEANATAENAARHLRVVKTTLALPANQREHAQVRQNLETLEQQAEALEDEYLKGLWEAYLQGSLRLRNPDSLQALLAREVAAQEARLGHPADSMELTWEPGNQQGMMELLDHYLEQQRTFLQFSEGFGARFPLLLTDAVVRGWPALNVAEFGEVFAGGTRLRLEGEMQSQYEYVMVGPQGPQRFAAVSGVTLQLVKEGRSQFFALEDFLQQENRPFEPLQALAAVANYFGLDSQNVHVAIDPGTGPLPSPKPLAEALPNLNLQALGPDFALQPDSLRRSVLAKALGSTITPLGSTADALAARAGRTALLVGTHSPMEPGSEALVRYALRRHGLDPHHTALLGGPAQLAELLPVRAAEGNWMQLQAFDLPPDHKALPLWANANLSQRPALAQRFARWVLHTSGWLDSLAPALSPTAQHDWKPVRDDWARAALNRLGSNPAQWSRDAQDVLRLANNLADWVERNAPDNPRERGHRLALLPDPDRVFTPDGKSLLAADGHNLYRMHPAALLACLLGPMAQLQYGTAKPLTDAQLAPLWTNLLDLGRQQGWLKPQEQETAMFQAWAMAGTLHHAQQLAQKGRGIPPGSAPDAASNALVLNVLQPAWAYLCTQAQLHSLPDELDYIARNLASALRSQPTTLLLR